MLCGPRMVIMMPLIVWMPPKGDHNPKNILYHFCYVNAQKGVFKLYVSVGVACVLGARQGSSLILGTIRTKKKE